MTPLLVLGSLHVVNPFPTPSFIPRANDTLGSRHWMKHRPRRHLSTRQPCQTSGSVKHRTHTSIAPNLYTTFHLRPGTSHARRTSHAHEFPRGSFRPPIAPIVRSSRSTPHRTAPHCSAKS
ncbi:hypothetical protein BKA63DRAFT_511940 [Paraphoma chrysanthemicola]|nr:hypothetical protein BKA63DRAFT_511940 [Paraphoma chrysanthemicola]